MIFDQFQRYETISRIISIIKQEKDIQNLKILEVGANAQKTLSQFISDEIFFTDIQEIKELAEDDHFFVADATNLENVKNDEYDLVIASDVFEHVPKQLRTDFLSEIYRVSKLGVIMCFPIGNEVTEQAEISINERYKELFGENHRWLIEHIENGLPRLADIEKFFAKKKIEYVKIEHGDIEVWKKFQKSSLNIMAMQQISKLGEIDEIYNKYIYNSDIGLHNYRVFYYLNKEFDNKEKLEKNILNCFEKKKNLDVYLNQVEEIENSCVITQIAGMNSLVGQLVDIVARQNQLIIDIQAEIEKYKK